jgi:threonine/homoserine/homoserine lactone efflux protein
VIIAATLVVFSIIGDPALGHRAHPMHAVSIARIVIGALMIGFGVRMWLRRNEPSKPSPIARRVDGLTAKSAVGMGLAVSAVDPASISLGLLAGVDIAAARLSIPTAVIVAAAFVLLSTVTITFPLAAYLAGGQAAQRRLAGVKDWLLSNEKAVAMVLLFVVGAMLIGRGIRDLTGL